MAFPQDPLGTIVQMKINGTWTNVTRYDAGTKILTTDGITIIRGAGGLQDKTPPGTCQWVWQDPNGIYNNENPRSPYYGLLSRNTPVRAYIPRTNTALLLVNAGDGAHGATTDKAALDIVGDIDVRIEIEPRYWRRWGNGSGKLAALCGKWQEGGNRSWLFRVNDLGILTFSWSTIGSDNNSFVCTAPLPTTGRIAVRVTLDVDNGSGGSAATFYTAPSISGSWTVLATVSGVITTSIFSGSSDLEIGSFNNGNPTGFSSLFYPFIGRIYSFELYNGIGGSLVAKADYTAQTTGTTSFSDGLGNTWTLIGVAEITNADYRFHGEFSAPTIIANKSLNGAGADVTIDVQAGGLIRRLTTNAPLLDASITKLFKTYNANGWWSGQDASTADTSSASSSVTGVNPATLTDITFAGYDSTLAGSAGVMVCGSTGPLFVGTCKSVPATTETHFIGYFKFPSIPLSNQTMFSMFSPDGTIKRWDWVVGATNYILNGYDATGTLAATKTTAFGTGAEPTNWIAFHLQLTNSAGTIAIKSEWMNIATGVTFTQNGVGTTSYSGTNGIINKIVVQGIAALASVRFSNVMATTQVGLIFWDGTIPTFAKISAAFPGETADARFIRVCGVLGIKVAIIGTLGDSEQMGAQPIATGMDVLYQCAEVDGGIIMEARDQLALEYRTRKSIYNQYGMTLTWANLSQGLQQTPDDTDVANDITLSRDNGGSARATLEYGPMSIQAPPNGINPVPDGPDINNYQDNRLPVLVQFALAKRTWPTSRYPEVRISLHRNDFVNATALALLATNTNSADLVTINTLPNFLAPDPIYVLIKGTTEELHTNTRDITYAAIPYGPYITSELSNTSGDFYTFKAVSDTIAGVVQTQVNTNFNSVATALSIKTLSGPLIDTTITSGVIKIGGERMTITSVSGASSPQTVNVTRGLDGYTAAHNANDYVYFDPTLKARL